MSNNANSFPRIGDNGQDTGSPPGILLSRFGKIDTLSIDGYVSEEGYAALRKVIVGLKPQEVIEAVKQSGLRGRGGAGFQTAKKWQLVAEASSSERYVIANAFNADPAAQGDRALLENDPHAVLEGLAIAAYAVGASEGYVYCCLDHMEAVQRVTKAIRQAEEAGYLGSDICGTPFRCHVSVVGAPASFAAGEETAAIAVIQGKRAMPSERPPYPSESGLWGKPTVVNNAETLANVPFIVRRGAAEFSRVGTQGNSGTKLITVTGRVNQPGVCEVPLGTSLRDIVARHAGNIVPGHQLKAVQFGGPTGACLPVDKLDLKLEFESLRQAGAIMGSGGLLVLDETACVVDFVRSQLQFLADESCGRCVPGRLGTSRLLFVLEQIALGRGRPGDLQILSELSQNMADGAVCGYGITAANPVVSSLAHFYEEYEAHVTGKRCPAGRCDVSAAQTSEKREELWRRKWPIRR